MHEKTFIALLAIAALCLTATVLGSLKYCYEKQRMYAEHGYTQSTLPGHTEVYWVNPNAATNSFPKAVR